MARDSRAELEPSSVLYLQQMEGALIQVESALAEAANGIASMRGLLQRLITYISADIETEPAQPLASDPALAPPPEETETSEQPAPAPVTPIDIRARPQQMADAPSGNEPGKVQFPEGDTRWSDAMGSKIDTQSVLTKLDERLRGLRPGASPAEDRADDEPDDHVREA
jgi:hypothetical protein